MVPTNAQTVADLSATLQRIADGASYIDRMEQLVKRAEERGEDPSELLKYLDGMRTLLRAFQDNRDLLQQAIRDAEPPSD